MHMGGGACMKGSEAMKYAYLLFDADDTLFDFPKASSRAFEAMCRAHDIPYTPEVYRLYHEINLELWAAFDRGELTKEFITLERYVRFLKALDLERDPAACNRDFLSALGEGVYPLPHAEAVCRALKAQGHRMYIVTNDGFVYGLSVAEDTGVRGSKVDLYFDTYEECINFGRRGCTVYILA